MVATLSEFKASNRNQRRTSVDKALTQQTPTPQPELFDPAPELSVLERMSRKNPELLNLVAALDLVEVSSSQPISDTPDLESGQRSFAPSALRTENEATPNLDSPQPAPVNVDRLKAIALNAFTPNCSYTYDEAINQLCEQTGVSIERATNGLTLMVEQQLLSRTPQGIYYLFESTPF